MLKFERTTPISQDIIFIDAFNNIVMVLVYNDIFEEYIPMSREQYFRLEVFFDDAEIEYIIKEAKEIPGSNNGWRIHVMER